MRSGRADLDDVATRATAGDESAFSLLFVELVRISRATAWSIACAAARHGEDQVTFLEEVVADAALKVTRELRSFRHEGSFEGYLRTVCRNTALDRLRAIKRRRLVYSETLATDPGADVDPFDVIPGPTADPAQDIDLQRAMEIFAAEDREAQRAVEALLANVVWGHSQSELAERFGVTRETVNRWTSRARRELRRRIAA